MKNALILIVLATFLSGCNRSWLTEKEKRDMEVQIYFGQLKNEVEFTASLISLIDSGDVEGVRRMLTTMQFLNLQTIEELTEEDFRIRFGKAYTPMTLERMESEVSDLLDDYYSENVERAGEQYVDIPSDIKAIRESREFLEKMRRRGFSRNVQTEIREIESKGD